MSLNSRLRKLLDLLIKLVKNKIVLMRLIGFKTKIFCHNEIKNGYGLESCDIHSGMLCERIEILTKVNGWGFTFGRWSYRVLMFILFGKKGEVFYGHGAAQRRIYYTTVFGGQFSTAFSNSIEIVKWPTPSCSQPEPARDNGVIYSRSN